MFYTFRVTAESDESHPPVLHKPCSIETLTHTHQEVTEEEIEMVAEAFKAQIKQVLTTMVRRTY